MKMDRCQRSNGAMVQIIELCSTVGLNKDDGSHYSIYVLQCFNRPLKLTDRFSLRPYLQSVNICKNACVWRSGKKSQNSAKYLITVK